jgi:nucleoside-diphosphate-sugar epimerase
MKVLIVGGSGLISTGIVEALLERAADVTLFNRGQRSEPPPGVTTIVGDRNRPHELEQRFARERFDAVIDMICFTPEQAEASVKAFGGRTEQLIFCSSVCAYGVDIPPDVLIDETFTRAPTTDYGRNKLACEEIFARADEAGAFASTIARPSNTYGPGASLIDQMEFDSVVWDRVAAGLPVLCAEGGLTLWQATHRRDVGRFFAHACGNRNTYGEAFNVTRDRVFTWRQYYREAAQALGTRARLVMAPAGWVLAQNPKRFAFLDEVTRYHGAYSSAKAKRAVPEFRCEVGFEQGARETFDDMRRRGAWRRHQDDAEYSAIITRALELGFEQLEASARALVSAAAKLFVEAEAVAFVVLAEPDASAGRVGLGPGGGALDITDVAVAAFVAEAAKAARIRDLDLAAVPFARLLRSSTVAAAGPTVPLPLTTAIGGAVGAALEADHHVTGRAVRGSGRGAVFVVVRVGAARVVVGTAGVVVAALVAAASCGAGASSVVARAASRRGSGSAGVAASGVRGRASGAGRAARSGATAALASSVVVVTFVVLAAAGDGERPCCEQQSQTHQTRLHVHGSILLRWNDQAGADAPAPLFFALAEAKFRQPRM